MLIFKCFLITFILRYVFNLYLLCLHLIRLYILPSALKQFFREYYLRCIRYRCFTLHQNKDKMNTEKWGKIIKVYLAFLWCWSVIKFAPLLKCLSGIRVDLATVQCDVIDGLCRDNLLRYHSSFTSAHYYVFLFQLCMIWFAIFFGRSLFLVWLKIEELK